MHTDRSKWVKGLRLARLLGTALALLHLYGLPTRDAEANPIESGEFRTARVIAQQLEARAQRMLDRTVGPGRSRVVVHVELDNARVEALRYDVTNPVAVSGSREEARSPVKVMTRERARYRVSRRVQRTESAGPRIRRITAAVALDATASSDELLGAVRAAIGFSRDRGDQVYVRMRK